MCGWKTQRGETFGVVNRSSRMIWMIDKVMPDYREWKSWLRWHGVTLDL